MNINKQRKLLHFKTSKLNKAFNYLNLSLIFITISGYVVFYLLIFFTLGLSMWKGVYRIGMPLVATSYNNIISITHLNVHIVDLEDTTLNYDVYARITTRDDYSVYTYHDFGTIKKMFLDNIELEIDEDNAYTIPDGVFDLKLEMYQDIRVDTYNGVTSAEIDLVNAESTTVSDFFRPITEKKESIILITTSSTGEYIREIYRTPIYQGIKHIHQWTVIYSIPNIIKIIVLFLLTIEARKEKKRTQHKKS